MLDPATSDGLEVCAMSAKPCMRDCMPATLRPFFHPSPTPHARQTDVGLNASCEPSSHDALANLRLLNNCRHN
eukprot:365036-Chlamydomonas_euryale.AAC.3